MADVALASAVMFVLILLPNTVSSSNFRYGVPPSRAVCPLGYPVPGIPATQLGINLVEFALNFEFLEAAYFLNSARGYGLDVLAPELVEGGPPPIGARMANLDPKTRAWVDEFGLQEVGHIRAIKREVRGFPRPLVDISSQNFANIMDDAFGYKLEPPFDPYRDSLSFVVSSYIIPYLGLNGYVGTIPNLNGTRLKKLVAGLMGVEAGQDAVIRKHLYDRRCELVPPYNITVQEFTYRISEWRNRLGQCGIKDEGIWVPRFLGAENMTESNVLSADQDSLSYPRTPEELMRIAYGTGDEHIPGGFYPEGANGTIAQQFLRGGQY